MKYALIGWNDKQQKRGAYTEAAALQSKYPDILDVFDANTKLDIDRLHSCPPTSCQNLQMPGLSPKRNALFASGVLLSHYRLLTLT